MPRNKVKAGGCTCMLVMDRHSSHFTPDLLCYSLDNHIKIIYRLSVHFTHALQGLDVVCFTCMKQAWTKEIERFEASHDHGFNKFDDSEIG